jgi:hypothetical protein
MHLQHKSDSAAAHNKRPSTHPLHEGHLQVTLHLARRGPEGRAPELRLVEGWRLTRLVVVMLLLLLLRRLHAVDDKKKKKSVTGLFKRLRRNGHQLEKDAENSSARTVSQKEAEPQEKTAPV